MLGGLDALLAQHAPRRFRARGALDVHLAAVPQGVGVETHPCFFARPRNRPGVALVGVAAARRPQRLRLRLRPPLPRQRRPPLRPAQGVPLGHGLPGAEKVRQRLLGPEERPDDLDALGAECHDTDLAPPGVLVPAARPRVTAGAIRPAPRVAGVDVGRAHHADLPRPHAGQPLQLQHRPHGARAEGQHPGHVAAEGRGAGLALPHLEVSLAEPLHLAQPVYHPGRDKLLLDRPREDSLDARQPPVDDLPAPAGVSHSPQHGAQALRGELSRGRGAVQLLQGAEGVLVLPQFLVTGAAPGLRLPPPGEDDLVDAEAGGRGGRAVGVAPAVPCQGVQDAGVLLVTLGAVVGAEQDVLAAAARQPHGDDGLAAGVAAVGRGRTLFRSGHGSGPSECGRVPQYFGSSAAPSTAEGYA
jgi:hypothetical protein